jgi:hypothetical protein
MSTHKQTSIEVLMTGLIAIFRPARGGIGVGIHKSAPHHSLTITLRETGGRFTRPDYPLVVAKGTLMNDIYLTLDGKTPKRDLQFDAYRMKLAVLDGQGFHNRKLSARQGVLTPCFYIDDAQFDARTSPVNVIHGQSRELRELAVVVSAKITLQGDEKASLTYGQSSHSFANDGRSYQLWVSNVEDLWHINSGDSDFQHYYSAFPEVEPEDRYELVIEKTEPPDEEATYERPCIPIFIESSTLNY